MTEHDFSPEFLEKLALVTSKRARVVIEHILQHGYITSETLKQTYGYNHPPRAVRDVRDYGIAIETFAATGADGRRIAAYRFAPDKPQSDELKGRRALSKAFKQALIEAYGLRCGICNIAYESRYLQIDHRVPFHIAGDLSSTPQVDAYMLVCASCNRAKSWSCEHCKNWQERESNNCKNPEKVRHAAA
jgi:predicted nucleotidyltransferase